MKENFTRRRLPHWDYPGATYFVTTCLAGSIPAQGLLELERLRASLKRQVRPLGMPVDEWAVFHWKKSFVQQEAWLDRQPGSRLLGDPRLASIVEKSLQHFSDERYELLAWVVMPSHYHWVFRPLDQWVQSLGAATEERSPRQRIQHSVNRHTAVDCNRLLGRTGGFWQRESYDHCIRDEGELERILAYIHANPVVAGIVERPELYRFSSAYPPNLLRVSKLRM